MRLYQTVEGTKLNELTSELFSYEYRDTDPVEEEIGKLFVESYNDDFIDPDTNLPRQRYSHTVSLLRQERSLDAGKPFDRLGFKGILRFKRKDVQFSLQARICNILNRGLQQAGAGATALDKPAKYTNVGNSAIGYVWDSTKYNPVGITSTSTIRCPFASLPDTQDGEEQCVKDIQRFYPNANAASLWRMLSEPQSYFSSYRFRQSTVLF